MRVTEADREEFRQGLTEEKRAEMIRRAEQIAKEIAEQRRAAEASEKAKEREIRARAAEGRSKSMQRPTPASPIEANETDVRALPRIPKKKITVRCSYLLYPALDDTDDEEDADVLSADSIEAECELHEVLFQEPEPAKPVAAVRPHTTTDIPKTIPIERVESQPAMELDDEEIAGQPEREVRPETGAIPRRPRSRSRRRATEPPVPVVIGPPGVPAHELMGSTASAPDEGRRKKKYNPRRHLELDDYEPFCLWGDRELPVIAVAVPPPSAKPVKPPTTRARDTSRVRWAEPLATTPSEDAKVCEPAAEPTTTTERPYFVIMWHPQTNVPYDGEDPSEGVCYNC